MPQPTQCQLSCVTNWVACRARHPLHDAYIDERSADAVKGGVKGARWLRERDGGRSLAHRELHAPRRAARAASGGTLTASLAGQVKRQHRERECAVVRDRLLEELQHPRDGLVLSGAAGLTEREQEQE